MSGLEKLAAAILLTVLWLVLCASIAQLADTPDAGRQALEAKP